VPFRALFYNRWLEAILLTQHFGLVLRENATWHYNGLAPIETSTISNSFARKL
jgi:hypothetical protein